MDAPICARCDEAIETENPRVMPHINADGSVIQNAMHDECFTRMVIGGLNHQRGTCSCQGGPDDPDPPHLTKRQAAIAAWAYYEGARSR